MVKVKTDSMKSNSNKTFDFVNHEFDIDKIIRSQFNNSQMSNAKWKKLFLHLAVQCPHAHAIWKFVGSDNDGVALTGMPEIDDLEDTYLNHRFWFGPSYYKEIEWLRFPTFVAKRGVQKERIRSGPSPHPCQDTAIIFTELLKIGHWPIEQDADGFTIYGHRRVNA